jgi:hypothetical protein
LLLHFLFFISLSIQNGILKKKIIIIIITLQSSFPALRKAFKRELVGGEKSAAVRKADMWAMNAKLGKDPRKLRISR